MAIKQVNGVELFYDEQGSGAETLFFAHGFLMDHTMFQGQVERFAEHFRCIAYDHRGHGRSQVTADGYDMDNLVTDAIALIEALQIAPVHFVGMSTGGFVGLRIALRRPELLKSLILMDTSAGAENPDKLKQYNLLLTAVRNVGWRFVIGQVMPILFHKVFLDDPQRKAEVKKWREIITGHDRKGIVPFGKGIFARDDVTTRLSEINLPAVAIVGKHDVATPIDDSQRIADGITDARLRIIPDAGHSSAVEKPKAVADAMQLFFERIGVLP